MPCHRHKAPATYRGGGYRHLVMKYSPQAARLDNLDCLRGVCLLKAEEFLLLGLCPEEEDDSAHCTHAHNAEFQHRTGGEVGELGT